jgi:hypothetical protein
MIRDSLDVIEVGICMSQMTVDQLLAEGLPQDRLCYVLPANDKNIDPRRLVIGVTSNLYSDGRKREYLLARLAREMDLRPFHFEVFGRNWSRTAEQLRAGGATVNVTEGTADYAADYAAIRQRVPFFDFYLYMGMDEGSLGVLDAMDAGVPTIVTPQGFHLDIPHAITHAFVEFDELRDIFATLAAPRLARIAAAAELTWTSHARSHLELWSALLEGRRRQYVDARHEASRAGRAAVASAPKRTPAQRVSDYLKLSNQYRWNMLKRYYLPRVKRRVQRARKALGLDESE